MDVDELQSRTRALFRAEATELLQDLESTLLDLERDSADAEAINRVFRALHTLKGSGATAGHRALSTFIHRIEDFYNAVREGRTKLSAQHVEQTLRVKDLLVQAIELPEEGAAALLEAESTSLGEWQAGGTRSPQESGSGSPVPAERTWSIRFEAKPGLWSTGIDVGVFWDDLRSLGRMTIHADVRHLGAIDHYNPEQCQLAWDIELAGQVSENQIRDVFAFAADDAVITVRQLNQPAAAVARPKVAIPDVLKVGADKVDKLVNLVGELVVLRAQLTSACGAMQELPAPLAAAEEGLRRLSEQMREVVLGVRMMRIDEAFTKFRRVVRDLAGQLGKEVEWSIEGGETEMDKTMLDRLAEPMLHMVRNSLDHGIETPAERVAAGKPRAGKIWLRAEQRGDRVCLALCDDGRGLDAPKIRAKAESRGLIPPDVAFTEQELFDLIFLPGFSTAESVSQVSGRGVGMDVVKRSIESLRGVVELSSRQGGGTEIRINLPLTLAIVDGLLVEVGRERYVLPLGAARETVELPTEERHSRDRGQILLIRGENLPYFRLRSLFSIPGKTPDSEKVVVVNTESGTFGVVVDRVIGQHQTVLKSLGWLGARITAFSGCTVLGDGRVALVLDVNSLWAMARKSSMGCE